MKINKTFRYDQQVIKHAEKNPLITSFADFATEAYREKYMRRDSIKDKLKKIKTEIEYLEKQYKKMPEEVLNVTLEQHQLRWVKEVGVKRLKRGTFEGVYKYFVNTYRRQDINRRQFRLLMEKYSK